MQTSAHEHIVFQAPCKDCGEPYYYTETAWKLDVARGLSAPERCPRCRRQNAAFIKSAGAAYWDAPIETDPNKRCWGKYGLGRLVRHREKAKPLVYHGIPTDAPPERFARIAKAAEDLLQNLLDPHGTQVSVLVGPTGTGKSTWVPYYLLRSKIGQEGRILVTQPRTITLRRQKSTDDDPPEDNTIPGFIARALLDPEGKIQAGAGQEIGFLYRGESTQQDRYTKLLYVTDGILIRWLISGDIGAFRVVMVDEAHEQSSNMELIFALLRYKLPMYPHLRVVIASATAEVERFQSYFGNGDKTKVFLAEPPDADRSTNHRIYDRWPEEYSRYLSGFQVPSSPREVPTAVASVVRAIRQQPEFTRTGKSYGDILVFVATISMVEQTIRAVEALQLPSLKVLPCHAQMSPAQFEEFNTSEQEARACEEGRQPSYQRVIVATNYAETSVTISNLSFVIDSGYIMELQWDPEICGVRPDTHHHSRAGCKQRMGRVGRTQEGEYFRLYTREVFDDDEKFKEHTLPAVAREPLDKLLLTAKAAGIDDLRTFQWLNRDLSLRENPREFERAQRALYECGAIDEDGDITPRGIELERVEAETLDLSLFMSESDAFACSLEVATFLAFIGQVGSPFLTNADGLIGYDRLRDGCYDDLEFYLRLFHLWQTQGREDARTRWAETNAVDHGFMEKVAEARDRNLRQFTKRTHENPADRELDLRRLHRVRLVLARCMPQWAFVRDQEANPMRQVFVPYDKALGFAVEINRDSSCVAIDEVDAFVCVERTRNRQGRVYAHHIVRISPAWLPYLDRDKATPLALAFLMKRELAEKGEAFVNACVQHVTGEPRRAADVAQYHEGQRLEHLTAVRGVSRHADDEDEEAGDFWLARDSQTNAPILVQRGQSWLVPGANFRADIQRVDRQRGTIIVSQERLFAEYRHPGKIIEAATISEVLKSNEGEPDALRVQLEGGITGVLRRRGGLPYSKHALLTTAKPGQPLSVTVLEIDRNDNIILAAPEVYAARDAILHRGQIIPDATIVGFDTPKGERVAAYVEVAPGKQGYLRRSALGRFGEARMRAAAVGMKIAVEIHNFSEDGRSIDLRPFIPSIAEGQRVQGYVADIKLDRYGHYFAWVEIAPDQRGFLHQRNSITNLNQLKPGTLIDVVVIKVGKGPRGQDQYDLKEFRSPQRTPTAGPSSTSDETRKRRPAPTISSKPRKWLALVLMCAAVSVLALTLWTRPSQTPERPAFPSKFQVETPGRITLIPYELDRFQLRHLARAISRREDRLPGNPQELEAWVLKVVSEADGKKPPGYTPEKAEMWLEEWVWKRLYRAWETRHRKDGTYDGTPPALFHHLDEDSQRVEYNLRLNRPIGSPRR